MLGMPLRRRGLLLWAIIEETRPVSIILRTQRMRYLVININIPVKLCRAKMYITISDITNTIDSNKHEKEKLQYI